MMFASQMVCFRRDHLGFPSGCCVSVTGGAVKDVVHCNFGGNDTSRNNWTTKNDIM